MSNDYFNPTGTPAPFSPGASAPMRAETSLVQQGFDKLPPLTGHGGEYVRVKANESGLESDVVGPGDVSGPGSSTDGNFAMFDGTTGQLIQDTGLSPSTDGTLAGNSDSLIPTQKAAKAYTDRAVIGPASAVDGNVVFFDGTSGKLAKDSGWKPTPVCIAIACSDETTALTTGTAKVTFISPYPSALTLTSVVASLTTAQTSGNIFTVDINEAGSTILSTKLTIDNTEKNSSTAATAPVISDASIAAFAEITVDIDQIGDGTAKGLKIYILGHL